MTSEGTEKDNQFHLKPQTNSFSISKTGYECSERKQNEDRGIRERGGEGEETKKEKGGGLEN